LRTLAARARSPRFALSVVVVAATGCHREAAPPARAVAPSVAPTADTSTGDASADATPNAPSLESLGATAERLAPGMREVARGQGPLPFSIPLPPSIADTCVRAVLAAPSPIVAALVTDVGGALAITQTGTQTTLEAQGPVCFRKGQAARIEVQGQASFVRYVVWMTP
jgi:hypothetical protein